MGVLQIDTSRFERWRLVGLRGLLWEDWGFLRGEDRGVYVKGVYWRDGEA